MTSQRAGWKFYTTNQQLATEVQGGNPTQLTNQDNYEGRNDQPTINGLLANQLWFARVSTNVSLKTYIIGLFSTAYFEGSSKLEPFRFFR